MNELSKEIILTIKKLKEWEAGEWDWEWDEVKIASLKLMDILTCMQAP